MKSIEYFLSRVVEGLALRYPAAADLVRMVLNPAKRNALADKIEAYQTSSYRGSFFYC